MYHTLGSVLAEVMNQPMNEEFLLCEHHVSEKCEHCHIKVATIHELCHDCMVELHGDPFDV